MIRELPVEPVRIIESIIAGRADPVAADELASALEIAETPPAVRDALLHYWDCRLAGSSPKLAEMFALSQAPQSFTDVEFLRGRHDNSQLFGKGKMGEAMGERMKRVAEDGGQNVKGKTYCGSLARFPGDPEAWVSGRSDVERVVRERGWRCEGDVTVAHSNKNLEAGAMIRQCVSKPGPGLDMDEDGHVERVMGTEDAKTPRLDRIDKGDSTLVEKRA